MYGVPIINRSLTIEVKLTSVAVGQTFQFPDNQIIRGQEVTVYAIGLKMPFPCDIAPNDVVSIAILLDLTTFNTESCGVPDQSESKL